MKKILLFTGIMLLAMNAVFAQIHRVRVSSNQFSPKTVNALVGDRIRWVWVNGRHTTTSTNIPANANPWDRPINMNNQTFTYTLRVRGTYRYKCTPHAALGMTGVIRVTRALEAGMADFAVNDENANATLTWKTASAKDLAYFSVQKSTDGENFEEITKVYPDLSNRYRFTDDNKTASEFVYYQVEMVDTKGENQLSEIQMYTRKAAISKLITSISPNPISSGGHLMFQFNADKEGMMSVQLFNGAGTMVKQDEMSAIKGLNNGHLHLGVLTPGVYYIVCTLEGIKEKHTIIVK